MSINHAILGILSCKPLTGYDLKKIMQESTFMYWSGNNNQIYKALIELLDKGLVTNEVHHQESSPSKKVYTITEAGLAELKKWVKSDPETPEFKKIFLIQLAWADQLSQEEMNTLLSKYENEVRMQMLMEQEKKRRETFSPGRTSREIHIWDLIHDNIIASYENELKWIKRVRREICSNIEEMNKMNYKVKEKENKRYILCDSAETQFISEQDSLDMIAVCFENNTNLIMLNAEVLADDFFKLRTGLAGQLLQKFVNYQIKVAVVLTNEQRIMGKFKEFLAEANRGNDFRVFSSMEEAEKWLLE